MAAPKKKAPSPAAASKKQLANRKRIRQNAREANKAHRGK